MWWRGGGAILGSGARRGLGNWGSLKSSQVLGEITITLLSDSLIPVPSCGNNGVLQQTGYRSRCEIQPSPTEPDSRETRGEAKL